MNVRRITAAGAVAALALALTACSTDPRDDEVANTDESLVIGVSGTNPGLAQINSDGSFSGFDVDLAAYIAKGLGWAEREITFTMVGTGEREASLADGSVDMVVSAYSITPERDKTIDFAGPYFIAGQDLLVATDSRITGPRSLNGQTVCGAQGFSGLARVKTSDYSPGAVLKEAATNEDCVELLLDGQVDAVTSDDAILAGFAADHPERLRVVGTPFSTEYYGIGLPEGSPDVAVINDLVVRAIEDGAWESSFDRHLATSGYTAPLPPIPGAQ